MFSVMSEFNLDDPGFTPPIPPVPPISSDSSVETPVDGRLKCSSCPRRMSKKSADRHTVCISCRGFNCDLNNRCEECLEWSEEDIIAYAKYRKSLKSRESSSSKKSKIPLTPLTPSRPTPQPAQQPAPRPSQPAPRPTQRDDLQSQFDSLSSNFHALSNNLTTQLTDFMSQFLTQNQSSRQTRLEPDAGESRPDQTAGESRMFQGEGAPSRTPLVPPYAQYHFLDDFEAPRPSSHAVIGHARLHLALVVPLPTTLCANLLHLRLRRNPPRLVGSRLALLPLGHVMTRRGLILEPAGLSQSRLRVTLPQSG